MRIFVKTLMGKTIVLDDINRSDTIETMKNIINKKENIPIERQDLIYAGKTLENSKTLKDYNIKDYSTIHFVLLN